MSGFGPLANGGVSVGAFDAQYFGTGVDGAATVTGAADTIGDWLVAGVMQRDVQLTNLTINASGSIDCNGRTIRGTGTLDLSAAPAGALKRTPTNGVTATTQSGGNLGAALIAGSAAGCIGGAVLSGGASTTTNGSAAQAIAIVALESNSAGGAGGAGGTDGVRTGGAGASVVAGVRTRILTALQAVPQTSVNANANSVTTASAFGGGGGGGAGSSTQTGGGGGGGGSSGGGINIFFKTINRGGSTATGAIRAQGGVGGNGFAPSNANTSGGGGGGGGQGGLVTIGYLTLVGSAATTCIDVSGGAGGNGGNANGTGGGGHGGRGGAGGVVLLWNLFSGALTVTESVNAAAGGNAPSGATGGSGTAGATSQVSL